MLELPSICQGNYTHQCPTQAVYRGSQKVAPKAINNILAYAKPF